MIEVRCKKCGSLLAKESIAEGELELFCRKCKVFLIINRDRLDNVDDSWQNDNDKK